MISSEKTSIWYNATVWLNQRQTAPQIWSNRDSVPMPCVLLRPKRCCVLALRLFLHKEAAARQAQAPLHLRRGNLAHAWGSRSSRARIDRKVTHGANTRFFYFYFFISVFYKNIFSSWKFTEIYPGRPAAGRPGPDRPADGRQGLI